MDGTFGDLRKLADWFSTSPQRSSLHIGRIVRRLGVTAVPMLGRELVNADVNRREAARDCLLLVASEARARVLAALRTILDGGELADEAKVCTLGLLAELGEHGAARFDDPSGMQRRSARALAAQLETAADVASAADMMVGKLDGAAIVQMLEALAAVAPDAAHRLASELGCRLDLDLEIRERIAERDTRTPQFAGDARVPQFAGDARVPQPTGDARAPQHAGDARAPQPAIDARAPQPARDGRPSAGEDRAGDDRAGEDREPPRRDARGAKRITRATHVSVLVDAHARFVVVASKKLLGEHTWRRWAVLIGSAGHIEDCIHEDAVRSQHGEHSDAAPLIAALVADGYRVASSELDHARSMVATAARITASRPDPQSLSSAYYLGRDLLDLGDAHLGPRRDARFTAALSVARAVELIAEGDHVRALALLDTPPPDDAAADHAAAVAACALAQGRHADAIEPLGKAIAREPAWPLHHWNLAVATHALGDHAGTFHALRRFLAASARPSALLGDPDQPARVAFAEVRIAELERAARLAGRPLTRRKRTRRPTAKSKPSTSSG